VIAPDKPRAQALLCRQASRVTIPGDTTLTCVSHPSRQMQ